MNELIHHGNVTFLMIIELFSFGIVHACVNRKDHKTKWFVSFDALRMSTHLARTIFSPKKSWTSKKRCPCFHSIPIILAKLHHLKYCPSTSSTSDHFSNVLSLELFTVTRLLYTRRESSTKIKSSGLKKKREKLIFWSMKQACSVQAVSNNNSVRLAHPKFEEESTTSLSLSIQSPLDATQLERNLVMMISLKN